MIYIISLGGSLIVPNENIDWQYLKKFRRLILAQVKQGHKFFIITGGGWTCRHYQNAAGKVIKITDEDLDWLGVHSTRLNAHLLRTIFFDIAHPEIITNPTKKITAEEPVVIAAGWKPGWSTDYDAVLLAKNYGANTIINLSNINYAYDKDPKKYHDAKIIKEIKWSDFRHVVGYKWKPGLSAPFDPIASALAEKLKLKVIIANGANLKNFENFINKGKIKGTVVS
ncbi:UMP kinase [Candidatus Falkowbacteria bacterium CG10_big_fil_rev_8_21_14_0_10_37_6]|uniref:Uridylate kinase n=1 Tax=Candidatus Falkowbacteria bacterium CG10_big_fil_rev_8_21_14_0_10_37_6 TaxID=1974563 RepID=A0A2H0V7A8_9BACT|nr:MAG: UMP kinase [Candidatus Falkowbacteria bacterium CG10_big_fil_rev_8_21_14_0_10_37_6]